MIEPNLVHFCTHFLHCGARGNGNSLQGVRQGGFVPSCICNLLLTSVVPGSVLTTVHGVDGVTLGTRWVPAALDTLLRGFVPAVSTYLEVASYAEVSRAITTVPTRAVRGVRLDRGRGAYSAVQCRACGLGLKSGHIRHKAR